jgi:hypothetical protein
MNWRKIVGTNGPHSFSRQDIRVPWPQMVQLGVRSCQLLVMVVIIYVHVWNVWVACILYQSSQPVYHLALGHVCPFIHYIGISCLIRNAIIFIKAENANTLLLLSFDTIQSNNERQERHIFARRVILHAIQMHLWRILVSIVLIARILSTHLEPMIKIGFKFRQNMPPLGHALGTPWRIYRSQCFFCRFIELRGV